MNATQTQHYVFEGPNGPETRAAAEIGRALRAKGGCVMTGQCCVGGPASQRLARWLSRVTASILPAAVLVLLPKCPLCLAAWLTVATGVSFSAAGAAWVRGSIVLLWVAVVAPIIWRRAFRRAPSFLLRLR